MLETEKESPGIFKVLLSALGYRALGTGESTNSGCFAAFVARVQ